MLTEIDFLDVVRLTPLVAIDLIVRDAEARVLIGHRRNRPARDTWFVPGGRIHKDETLDAAFARIADAELGIARLARSTARFEGVFEHHYEDNFAAEPGVSTHYIVLAYALQLTSSVPVGRLDQHSEYLWLSPAALLARPDVHENTKAYFR
ncbi:GDP-mannose mannosyl hydrolase [Paraburkholderia fungorum]|jgi:colanic acid biosynthesis protein WcaH|uniref:GDP-mannose mannosyl hydrolase n=1 Tax=Paraburkholderia fungorum TaxID=134537 RepID=A0AAP5Q603_9BURK|nr:GDP-mannose mannosyl hydrolase [Paraburkholderia fungorum]MBU7437333.1 GDP-mannose mannosyl hydrolase [Paraburkholderia fungorum]MDT8838201.1 GDP-mannose mannosyl hydrolase [Paraburkholderia fungorum]PRZ48100.1 colanic acid biosynthesis protein WcaH [Paraburkholderia fungorum]PZR49077.1 MAG: GDP-mannose mannosyl hydrolase [Paraburkholderia fungorum]QLD48271.1 GDP-mannose mannosyl hydrolase [Paraburkholderia fungorum]